MSKKFAQLEIYRACAAGQRTKDVEQLLLEAEKILKSSRCAIENIKKTVESM